MHASICFDFSYTQLNDIVHIQHKIHDHLNIAMKLIHSYSYHLFWCPLFFRTPWYLQVLSFSLSGKHHLLSRSKIATTVWSSTMTWNLRPELYKTARKKKTYLISTSTTWSSKEPVIHFRQIAGQIFWEHMSFFKFIIYYYIPSLIIRNRQLNYIQVIVQ